MEIYYDCNQFTCFIKRLCDYLIKSTFEINFKFHTNLDFEDSKILIFP